jgi:hypothetical protein
MSERRGLNGWIVLSRWIPPAREQMPKTKWLVNCEPDETIDREVAIVNQQQAQDVECPQLSDMGNLRPKRVDA